MDNRIESCHYVYLPSLRAVGQLDRMCTIVHGLCLPRRQAGDVWILQRCKFMGVVLSILIGRQC